jgi:cell division protein FtsL
MNTQQKKHEPNGIAFFLLFKILLGIAIVTALAGFKIYIANQIYYESRRVNYIEREVVSLREEKLMLEAQLEQQKYKNRINDTAFFIDTPVDITTPEIKSH